MKFSQLFFRNNFFAKDNQSLDLVDLMRKACFIHQDGSGVFSMLQLGLRLQRRIETVVREEMEAIGFGEMQLSLLQDTQLWEQTQRIDSYGQELFQLKDRKGHSWCLGATAEELITNVVKTHYQNADMNLRLYQVGNKYRDELRARAGLIRAKQFVMKDAYSFCTSAEALDEGYTEVRGAYERIFQRLGLDYSIVASDSGEIGGSFSEEFVVESEFGEEVDGKKLLEVGHIFKLGQTYSEKMGLKDNLQQFVHMGCYGIGISRLLMALCEQRRDAKGFWGDDAFATFDVVITSLDYHRNEAVKDRAETLYAELRGQGLQVLLDDRNETTGKKLSDSEIVCAKRRVVVSQRGIDAGELEWSERHQ